VTAFDWVFLAIVVVSTLAGFVRGFLRVVVSLVAWVAAVLLAIHLSSLVAGLLPAWGSEAARHVGAFVLVVVLVLIVGALIGWALHRLATAVGLGFLDRLLGAVVGVARGVLIAVIGVLAAGLTSLPKQDWWQNALLAPPLVAAAFSLKPWLPKLWADGLDYSKAPAHPAPARKVTGA
jgi:membrane protein required for colicin V production